MTTTYACVKVANLRKKSGPGRKSYSNFREWLEDKNNVYTGRYGRIFITTKEKGASSDSKREIFHYKGSKWANPYKITSDMSRKEVVDKYLDYLFEKREGKLPLIYDILELKGKTLGCFCDENEPVCHAKLLMNILNKCDIEKMFKDYI